MDSKIIKIGNSSGIIIPSAILKDMGVQRLDEVEVGYSRLNKALTITTKKKDSVK